MNTARTMIIVWSWKHGGLTATHDEWSTDSDINDKLIRADIPFTSTAIGLLRQMVEAEGLDRSVYLFLHRRHGYSQKAISQILNSLSDFQQSGGVVRSFLFGEGGDYIYIANNHRGLLGTKGTFSAKLASPYHEKDQLVSAIVRQEEKLVKSVHFNAVWQHYSYDFKAKIFELREDLFVAFLPFLDEEPLNSSVLYAFLQREENQLLFLRLLSFIGKIRKGTALENTLRSFEQTQKRSFFFDDCQENLKAVYGVQEGRLYEELVMFIKTHLFVHDQTVDLRQLRKQFDVLLRNMPELAYT